MLACSKLLAIKWSFAGSFQLNQRSMNDNHGSPNICDNREALKAQFTVLVLHPSKVVRI
jgi:hypothetical protein